MPFTAQQIGFELFRTGFIVTVVLLSIKPVLPSHQYPDLYPLYTLQFSTFSQFEFQVTACIIADELPDATIYRQFIWQHESFNNGFYSPGWEDDTITAIPLPSEPNLTGTNNGFVLVENESEILLDVPSNHFKSTTDSFFRKLYLKNPSEIQLTLPKAIIPVNSIRQSEDINHK